MGGGKGGNTAPVQQIAPVAPTTEDMSIVDSDEDKKRKLSSGKDTLKTDLKKPLETSNTTGLTGLGS